VIGNHLLLCCERQILQTRISLLEVDVAKTAVEQDLAGVQLELQAQLFVVDVVVATQVQECVVEVGERLLKVAHEEVRDTLLEVCDGEILVQTHSALVAVDLCSRQHVLLLPEPLFFTHRFLMFAECRMDYTAVEEDLGSVGDLVKHLQCVVELVAIVAGKGCHPGFDFLPHYQQLNAEGATELQEGRCAPASET
jgi:hypothetical protein